MSNSQTPAPIKVIHLVAGSLHGGAAKGAYNLHRSLVGLGIESKLLTSSVNVTNDPAVISLCGSRWRRARHSLIDRLGKAPKLIYSRRMRYVFNTGFTGIDIRSLEEYRNTDIVHLHWINGLISIRMLSLIDKPIVWTMRDMWPMTGGCHYSLSCNRYQAQCGSCPQLESDSDFDLSRVIWNTKKKFFPDSVHAVGISKWISDCARSSTLFSGHSVATIRNGIDCSEFEPIDRNIARNELGLPLDKKVVLIGAQDVSDCYKGFDLFLASLGWLKKEDLHIVVFGKTSVAVDSLREYQTSYLGYIDDTAMLSRAYSAADVFVAPSRMEAFGKTIVEAMACKTPVVCFDATGPKEIVKHRVTGFRAEPLEPQSLAAGINWVFGLSASDLEMCRESSRRRAIELFDSRLGASQYRDLYRRILANKH